MGTTITDVAQDRQQAHAYLDHLPPEQLRAVRDLLRTMVDPVSIALANAPIDDEPLTEEDREAIERSREWLKHNDPIPLEEVLSELGVTTEQWEEWGRTPLPDENGSRG